MIKYIHLSHEIEKPTLEKDLEASGDCIILYSECNFKGFSKKTCDSPEEALSFELPI
jgi:hypothetical protein